MPIFLISPAYSFGRGDKSEKTVIIYVRGYKMALTRAHIIITGRVQGVGYRYFTIRRAEQLGLKGWVKNLYNGVVETEVEGDKSDIKTLIEYLWQGPSLSRVTDVKVNWLNYTGEYNDFSVRFW